MCGLYGYTTNTEKSLDEDQKDTRERILKSLAIAMESRGVDSAGMAFVKDNATILAKKAITSTKFLKRKNVKSLLANSPTLVLGHTRQATSGIVNNKNAHPFLKGDIMGCHNGIVSNELEINGSVEVDSELIFMLLNKSKNDFEKTFKRLSGSFAITWLDTKHPNTVYFVTHDNPLFLVYVAELKTIFWSSTRTALKVVLTATVGLGKRDIWSPKENTVYKINPNLRIEKYKVKFKKDDFIYDYTETGRHGKKFRHTKYKKTNGVYQQELMNQDLSGFKDRSEEEEYSESEIIKHQVDNFGCENCNKAINPKRGFYWNYLDSIALCNKCGYKHGNTVDYEFFNHQDYLDLELDIEADKSLAVIN